MCELEREGLSAKEARKRIVRKVGGRDGNGKATLSESHGRLIDHLECEIERLQLENERLWGVVQGLKALPAPKRQHRLFGIFRRRKVTTGR